MRTIEINIPTSLRVRRATAPKNTLRRSFFNDKAITVVPMSNMSERSAIFGCGTCCCGTFSAEYSRHASSSIRVVDESIKRLEFRTDCGRDDVDDDVEGSIIEASRVELQ